MTKEENEREYKVISQSISMHSCLADEYARRERWLSVSLMIISAVLCAFTFADDQTLKLLGAPEKIKLGIGVLSATVFGLSIIEWKVKWGEISQAHADSSKRLAALKLQYRRVYAALEADKSKMWAALTLEYAQVSGTLHPIGERDFLRLKAHHNTKVKLSKLSEQHPGVPSFILAFVYKFMAIWRLITTRKNEETKDPGKT